MIAGAWLPLHFTFPGDFLDFSALFREQNESDEKGKCNVGAIYALGDIGGHPAQWQWPCREVEVPGTMTRRVSSAPAIAAVYSSHP